MVLVVIKDLVAGGVLTVLGYMSLKGTWKIQIGIIKHGKGD